MQNIKRSNVLILACLTIRGLDDLESSRDVPLLRDDDLALLRETLQPR